MSSPETFPDIEIYLRQAGSDAIVEWLDERFGVDRKSTSGKSLACQLLDPEMTCVIVENAVGDFTSVWFKSGNTPWQTDTDCGREAFAHFSVEVRCSTGPWQEGADEDEWLSISGEGEQVIRWPT
jgi:hypothetical protein